jgi:hypothetical protein
VTAAVTPRRRFRFRCAIIARPNRLDFRSRDQTAPNPAKHQLSRHFPPAFSR